MSWPTRLTKLLNIKYPIIQAPMLGITSPEMVAAIANLGGLGSLPVGGLSPDKTLELIKKTKSLTSKPFAVNLFAHNAGPVDSKAAEAMQNYLLKLADRNDVKFEKLKIDSMKFHTYKEQIDILIAEDIPIVSFTFGVLDDDILKNLKSKNITLIGTATCVKEAKILDSKGVDAITAQGIEAGGHRGSFLLDEPLPQIGSISLIPLIVDNTSKPVLASGGINDGRTIKAAFALGASGVQIGTAFLGSDESVAISSYKELLSKCTDTSTALTRSFSGRWARGIKNSFMEEVEKEGLVIPDYPVQNSLTGSIRAVSQKKNNNQFTNMWAGQSVEKCTRKSSAEIFNELVRQAESL